MVRKRVNYSQTMDGRVPLLLISPRWGFFGRNWGKKSGKRRTTWSKKKRRENAMDFSGN